MKTHFKTFCRAEARLSAFTLIELLAITIAVAVLAGITFGVSRGVLDQQARTQAKAELALIAQALEEFKLTYGDYPVISEDDPLGNANARALTKALTGFSYLEPGPVPGSRAMTDVNDNEARKSFTDVEKLTLNKPFRDPDNPTNVPNSAADLAEIFLMDPWRQAYVYVYNRGASDNDWDQVGYVLFSKGPDREADSIDVDTGIFDPSDSNNLDNIYPNQE